MSVRERRDQTDSECRHLGDIHELVMTPCEKLVDMPPDTPQPTRPFELPPRKKIGVYVNFFEEPDSPNTQCLSSPRTPDVHENMINIEIPRGSELYLNYEKFHFDSH
jgi:hypothetical protein